MQQRSDPYHLFGPGQRTKKNLRKHEKLNVKEAKERVNQYATWAALQEHMTAVDLVSAVKTSLVKRPTATDSVANIAMELRKALRRQASITGGANVSAIEDVVHQVLQQWQVVSPGTVLGTFTLALALTLMFPGTIRVVSTPDEADCLSGQVWELIDRHYTWSGKDFDVLQERLSHHDRHMRETHRKAKRVLQGWKEKAGTKSDDVIDSSDDENEPNIDRQAKNGFI